MEALRRQVLALAPTPVNVLIRGETGSGKELVARCLHDFGPRADKPFVALNCAAIPEQLFESELFGHESGAFTGAQGKRIGKLEHAHGGTLFLDEIESMPLAQQVKLLRVLQEQQLERLGSNQSIHVDLRVIAATKPDLLAEASCRTLPRGPGVSPECRRAAPAADPRASRGHPAALRTFRQRCQPAPRPRAAPAPAELARLMAHDWPGNVRELANAAERHVLGLERGDAEEGGGLTSGLAERMEAFEAECLRQALGQCRGISRR